MGKSKTPSLGILMALGVLGFGSLAFYVANSPNSKVPDELRRKKDPAASQQVKEGQTKIFMPKANGPEISLDQKVQDVPKGEDPMVFAVNEFLKEAKVTSPEAKLLGVDLDGDGVAILSFNQAFRQTYGSLDEKTLLDGIRASLGQFDAVKKIRFTIEGEVLESLGNVDLTEPIDVLPEKEPVDLAP